ncbi:MAG: ABC transporter substrate-binding protein [Candidatus Acidiferrales bacterium]
MVTRLALPSRLQNPEPKETGWALCRRNRLPGNKRALETGKERAVGTPKPHWGCCGHKFLGRGLKFWEAAVKEAGSLNQEAVIKALDHAKIAAGPGGPAAMVPGQHHARMNLYIAQASNGIFKVVQNLGVIEPDESVVSARHVASR